MSFKNTMLATIFSVASPVLALAGTADHDVVVKPANTKAKSSVTRDLGNVLNNEFSEKTPRDTGTQLAQFGFGPPIYNRRYGGSFSPMQRFNQRMSPYGFNGLGTRFGSGATNGLGFNRFNQQHQQGLYNQNQGLGQQQTPMSNANQPQAQSAIKSHQATAPNSQLNFQERILAREFTSKLNFKDSSIPESDKQIVGAILAKTQMQFNQLIQDDQKLAKNNQKLADDDQKLAKFGELFNANSVAAGYPDGASAKVIPAYYKLSQKNQEPERKSIPEPKLEEKPMINSATVTYGYRPIINLESRKLLNQFSNELDSLKFKTPLSPSVKARMANALVAAYGKYAQLGSSEQNQAKYTESVTTALNEQGFTKPVSEALLKKFFEINNSVTETIANENDIPEIEVDMPASPMAPEAE